MHINLCLLMRLDFGVTILSRPKITETLKNFKPGSDKRSEGSLLRSSNLMKRIHSLKI